MNTSLDEGAQQVKVGGVAALYLAAAYVVAMLYFLVFVKYSDVVDPVERVNAVVAHHGSMRLVNLLSYVVFGVVLAILAVSLHSRLRHGAAVLSQAAAVVGCIWATVLVASGLVVTAGGSAVVALHATSPTQAVAAWQAIEPVADGLGGAGGELLGGLWVLLVSMSALRASAFPRALSWSGIVVGSAGAVSVLPGLAAGAYVFGLLQILWFVWLGIVLLRMAPRGSEPASFTGDHAAAPLDDATAQLSGRR